MDIQSGQPGGIRHLELADTPQQSMDLGGVNFQTLGFQLQGGTLTSSGGSATLTAPTYTLGGGLIDTGVALGPSGVVTQSSGLTVLKDGLISGASSVTVGSGARLTGTGVVDPLTTTIMKGGALAPGNVANPTGMLTIAGNLAFQSGALYLIQATPSAASSTLVNGSASLNGTVQASFASGSYVTKQYNILATTGGLGGSRFSSLANTNLPAGFNDNLSYASSHFNSLSSALSASKDCTARPPGLHPRLQPASISGSGDGNSSFGRAHPTKWIPRGFAEITAR